MASSHVLKKLTRSPLLTAIPFRQSPSSCCPKFHTSAETSTSSFRTSKQFLRSVVQYRSRVAVGTSLSRFINKKDFHVHVSDEDYGKVVARVLEPYPTIIHYGECLSMLIYMPVMESNHVNVTVEDNMLLCKGTRPDGKPATDVPHYTPNYAFPMIDGKQRKSYVANYIPVSLLPKKPYTDVNLEVLYHRQCGTYACRIELPNKTYTPDDVEANMKDYVLLVTCNNVTKDDVAPFI